MILKIRDDSPYEEGWLYVDRVISTKVEYTTYALTKDFANEKEPHPRDVHDEIKREIYRLGIHQIATEHKVVNDGKNGDVAEGSFHSYPNREVEFYGGKLLLNWRSLIKDYKIGGNDHIGIKMIIATFDAKDGKEHDTYIIQKGQEAYLLSDTGKTIERI